MRPMKIELIAYAFVTPGGEQIPRCGIGEVKSEVLDYFSRHLTKIWDKAKDNIVDPARFLRVEGAKPGEEHFEALRTGSDEEFIKSANALVEELHSVTDNRMSRGFFVALRATRNKKAVAAVLKLDVYDFTAARLEQVDDSSALFEPVLDLLDLPGDLHKGALFPDPRRTSHLAVVDVFETHYFLRSLHARLYVGGRDAVDQFDYLVRKEAGPEVARQVRQEAAARETPAAAPALVRASKALPPAAKKRLLEELEKPRSIGKVDVRSHPRTTTIYADGIEISGAEQEIAAKVEEGRDGAKWLIQITADSQPTWKTR
ncbi:MAG: hypothetical protein SX243_25185 [Acidobacteriota bacterium]|nr:hypothetical protein [Acidobacteriota bacterium]